MSRLTDEQREDLRSKCESFGWSMFDNGYQSSTRHLAQMASGLQYSILKKFEVSEGVAADDVANVRITYDQDSCVIEFHIEDK